MNGADAARRCLIRLLVVDDDLGSVEQLGQLLKGFAEVSFATRGDEALRLATLQGPDLVLLDLELPGLDGAETCRRLRATPGLLDLPIIAVSRHADAAMAVEAQRLGADDLLAKPLHGPLLLQRLRRHLRRRAALQRLGPGPARGEGLATAAMLSYIAHEMGNPVGAIRGFAQLMQASPLPAGQAEKLSYILDAAERLRTLLADVSDVARMGSGRFSLEAGEVELGGWLQQACGPARAEAAQAGMRLVLPEPRGPVRVLADARRLRQCLDNLLSNAIKYGRGGGRVDLQIESRGGEVMLAVQDHGDGLSDGQLAQLFEPYNRLGREGGSIPGTGLGLTVTRELVRAMGGRLLAHSDGAGRGCRFELVLRAAGAA